MPPNRFDVRNMKGHEHNSNMCRVYAVDRSIARELFLRLPMA